MLNKEQSHTIIILHPATPKCHVQPVCSWPIKYYVYLQNLSPKSSTASVPGEDFYRRDLNISLRSLLAVNEGYSLVVESVSDDQLSGYAVEDVSV